MHAQRLTARIAQRTTRHLILIVLACGLLAGLLTPTSAFAGTLRPEASPDGPFFARPDLAPSVWLPNGTTLGTGERFRVNGVVANQGQGSPVPARISLVLLDDLKSVTIVQAPAGFRCGQRKVNFALLSGWEVPVTEVRCEGGKVGPSAPASIIVEATTSQPGSTGLVLEAETIGNSRDKNEENDSQSVSISVE